MIQRLENIGDQGPDIFHSITSRHDDKNGDGQRGQILLKLDILVSRNKYVELGRCQRQ